MLRAFMARRTITRGALLVFLVATVIFTTVPRGDRTYVLAAFLPLVTIPYLRRDTFPRLPLVIAGIVISVLTINVLIALRHVETRAERGVVDTTVHAVTHPLGQMSDFLTGVDLTEFTVMEVEYQAINGGGLEYQPGSTFFSVAAGAMPRRFFKEKPRPATWYLANWMFPNRVRTTTFVPSYYGDLYGDYGLWTVAFYCLLTGIFSRWLWEYYRRNRHSEGMQIVFAAALPLYVALMRNNLSDIGGRMMFLVFPLVACLLICGRRAAPRHAPPAGAAGEAGPGPSPAPVPAAALSQARS
jgi:hypothetical protein